MVRKTILAEIEVECRPGVTPEDLMSAFLHLSFEHYPYGIFMIDGKGDRIAQVAKITPDISL